MCMVRTHKLTDLRSPSRMKSSVPMDLPAGHPVHRLDDKANIHEAAFCGDIRELKQALSEGQDPTAKDFTGTSAFHKAAANGNNAILQILIDSGCDVNQKDNTQCTAIHKAAKNGHLHTLKWLVDHGGDVKILSAKGRTALDMAKAQGMTHITTFLKNCERKKMSWET